MRFEMMNHLLERGNGIAEMMELSATLYGVCQFTFGPVGRNQFQVGPLSGKLQELDMCGLQGVVDHGRGQVIPKAEAMLFRCGFH